METVKSILDHEGLTWTDVVKVTKYLTDVRDQDGMVAVLKEYFGTRTTSANMIIPTGSRIRPGVATMQKLMSKGTFDIPSERCQTRFARGLLAFEEINPRCRGLVSDGQNSLKFWRMKPREGLFPTRKFKHDNARTGHLADDRFRRTA
jgi:hypothetical protein